MILTSMLPGYQLIRSNRKTLSLQIKPDGELLVRAPRRFSLSEIEAFIVEKQHWIRKHQLAMAKRKLEQPEKQFVSGEQFLYLGKTYPLFISASARKSLIFDQAFYLASHRQMQAESCFEAWYRKQAKQIFNQRVAYYAARHSLTYRSVKINGAKTRWGSCSADNHLNFSWRLVMAPMAVIDYVVVHELSHTLHKNHSADFWACVASIYPDYQASRHWLKQKGYQLSIR